MMKSAENITSLKEKFSLEAFNLQTTDRIIEMAWEDRTPFEAIAYQFNMPEKEVISLMRRELSVKSFKRWRKRVAGRKTKHMALRAAGTTRFKSKQQKSISGNRIAKRP